MCCSLTRPLWKSQSILQPCARLNLEKYNLAQPVWLFWEGCATLKQSSTTFVQPCDKLVQPYATVRQPVTNLCNLTQPCDNLVQPGTTLLQSHFGDCIFVKGIQYTDFISSSKCEIIQKITSGHILSWYPSFFRLSRYPGAHFGTRDSQNVSKHLILELSIISFIKIKIIKNNNKLI